MLTRLAPALFAGVLALGFTRAAEPAFDLIVADGSVYDDTGVAPVRADGREEFRQRAANPVLRAKMQTEIINALLTDRGGGDLRCVQFAAVTWRPDLEGRTLADWCTQRGLTLTPENGAELTSEGRLNGGASCIYWAKRIPSCRG